jgi:hypothetical protein
VADSEGERHAGPCQWTGSGEGQTLSLDRETKAVG